MTEIDLTFIARQIDRLISDNAALRDDVNVLTAIVLRLDGSQSALLTEVRAVHSQISRMNDRVRKLESPAG
jgi:hypothetical protein